MGTRQDSSLRALEGRQKPPFGHRNQPDTVHKAGVYATYENEFVFEQNKSYAVLVFSMDTPIQWDIQLTFSPIASPTPPGVVQVTLPITVLGDVNDPTGNTIYNPTVAAAIDAFTQGKGVTLTNKARVRGYLGVINVPQYGLFEREGGVQSTADGVIFMWCQGPQMFGWPTMAATYGSLFPPPSPPGDPIFYSSIYLAEAAYTPELAKDGNVSSSFGIIFERIVGLISPLTYQPIPPRGAGKVIQSGYESR